MGFSNGKSGQEHRRQEERHGGICKNGLQRHVDMLLAGREARGGRGARASAASTLFLPTSLSPWICAPALFMKNDRMHTWARWVSGARTSLATAPVCSAPCRTTSSTARPSTTQVRASCQRLCSKILIWVCLQCAGLASNICTTTPSYSRTFGFVAPLYSY